jgi:hypothetical protein
MVAPRQGATLSAILHFQRQYASLTPGSERAAITERAISIAVRRSFQGASNQHFDIWRNARFAHWRSEKRRREAHSQLKEGTVRGVAGVAATGGQTSPTPEELLIAADLEAHLRLVSAQVHPHGERTLHGMLTGELESETAEAVGVAPRTIRRVRRAIRVQAERLIGRTPT